MTSDQFSPFALSLSKGEAGTDARNLALRLFVPLAQTPRSARLRANGNGSLPTALSSPGTVLAKALGHRTKVSRGMPAKPTNAETQVPTWTGDHEGGDPRPLELRRSSIGKVGIKRRAACSRGPWRKRGT